LYLLLPLRLTDWALDVHIPDYPHSQQLGGCQHYPSPLICKGPQLTVSGRELCRVLLAAPHARSGSGRSHSPVLLSWRLESMQNNVTVLLNLFIIGNGNRFSSKSKFCRISLTQCCGSKSARIRNFCRIRNRIRTSRVPDPGPYPKMDVNINKNYQKKG
jgi:hypothetical protein